AAFSRQEKQPPHHAQGNLNTVLRRVIEGLQKTAPPTIRWQVQLADCLYSVKFDESKVQQALTKIIDNAVDAVGDRGAITLSTRRGGVAVSSVYRQGTSVRVYLPATQEFVSEPLVLPPDNNNRQTILIVDDEDLLLAMGRTVLTAFGYQVLTANSGRQALEIIDRTSTPIEMIIADLVMSHMMCVVRHTHI